MKSPKWKYPQDGTQEEKKAAMLAALKTLDNKSASLRILRLIANEYMFESQIAGPIWQSLANNPQTPPKIVRDLEQKQLWYLDILLVQQPHASKAYVYRMKDLPKDIRLAHADFDGYDRNKELRAFARKRLGLPPEERCD